MHVERKPHFFDHLYIVWSRRAREMVWSFCSVVCIGAIRTNALCVVYTYINLAHTSLHTDIKVKCQVCPMGLLFVICFASCLLVFNLTPVPKIAPVFFTSLSFCFSQASLCLSVCPGLQGIWCRVWLSLSLPSLLLTQPTRQLSRYGTPSDVVHYTYIRVVWIQVE